MNTIRIDRLFAPAAIAAALFAGSVAFAQGADYQAAKAAGQIGELPTGYIGIVGSGNAGLKAMVDDINIKRKAVYADKAQAAHATVEEYAFTSGCLLIAKTRAGEKYQAPDGSWQTRTASAPVRDSRCPAAG